MTGIEGVMVKMVKTQAYSGPERRNGNGNGSRYLTYWIMGAMLSVLLIGGSAWAAYISNQINIISGEMNHRQQRISKNESIVTIVLSRMDRIESKIDSLLENRKSV